MKERGQLQAVWEGRCPRCREGKLFKYGVYNILKINKTYENCPHCDLRYEQEPGFFYGAMYVSYAFSVAILLTTTFLIYNLVNDPSLTVYISSVTIISILTYPINFRYSRILFLHVFGGFTYQPKFKKP